MCLTTRSVGKRQPRVLGPSTSALLALHPTRAPHSASPDDDDGGDDGDDEVPNRVHVHLTGGEYRAPTAWSVTPPSEAMVTGVVLRVVASTVDDAEVALCALMLSAGLVGCIALAAPAIACAFRDWVAVEGGVARIPAPHPPTLSPWLRVLSLHRSRTQLS